MGLNLKGRGLNKKNSNFSLHFPFTSKLFVVCYKLRSFGDISCRDVCFLILDGLWCFKKDSAAMSLSSNHDPVTQDTPRTTVFPSKLNRRKRVSPRGQLLTKRAYSIPQLRRTSLNLAIFTTLIRYSYKLRSIYVHSCIKKL